MISPLAKVYYTKAVYSFTQVGNGSLVNTVGSFTLWPIFATVIVVILFSIYAVGKAKNSVVTAPYMCGETADNDEDRPRFRAIADGWVDYSHSNYYLNKVFGEEVLTNGSNIIAILGILVMLIVSYMGL
jgi:hypothetical protein